MVKWVGIHDGIYNIHVNITVNGLSDIEGLGECTVNISLMSYGSVLILFVPDFNWFDFIVTCVTGIFIRYPSPKKTMGKNMCTQYKEKYHNLLKSQILPKLLHMAGKGRGKYIDIRRYRDRYAGQLQKCVFSSSHCLHGREISEFYRKFPFDCNGICRTFPCGTR